MDGRLGATVKFRISLLKNEWPFEYAHLIRTLELKRNEWYKRNLESLKL